MYYGWQPYYPMESMPRLPVLLLALCTALPADPIGEVFQRLYNFDFPSAHSVLDRHLDAQPDDPMGHSTRAAVLLFYELDRLGILEAELFADDRRLTDDKKKLRPDPDVRTRFFGAVETAQSRAQSVLATRPSDPDALYALCMSQGLVVDYTALIDKKNMASLSLAKRANACAQRLLKEHPNVHDAYVTVGFTEYLVGSLPFFVRWFVRFDGVEGSKRQGIRVLQQASQSGRYLGPFAKILLAVAWLREKNPHESRRLLAEFNRDYPGNQLVRRELDKLSERLSPGAASSP